VGRARPDKAGVRRGRPGWHRLGSGAASAGAGAVARGSDMRERSGKKKGRACVLYPLMFIGPTHQSMNISGLTYVAAVAPYVRRS
jgi:hypothetical protein